MFWFYSLVFLFFMWDHYESASWMWLEVLSYKSDPILWSFYSNSTFPRETCLLPVTSKCDEPTLIPGRHWTSRSWKNLCWPVHSKDKHVLSSGHCFTVKEVWRKPLVGLCLCCIYWLAAECTSGGCFCSYFRAKNKPLITQQQWGFSQKSLHNGHDSFPFLQKHEQ